MPASPLLIAHRGASALAPENSLDALEAAIATGADLVEADVRMSSDGVPVVTHDPDLRRTHGRPVEVGAVTAAGLEACGVLRLAALVAAAAGRIPLLLDLKEDGEPYWDRVVAATRHVPRDEVVYGVRSPGALARLRARRGDARTLGLLPPAALPHFAAEGGTIARLWEGELSAAIGTTRALGLPVWVTAGGRGTAGEATAEGLHAILAFGVDGVLLNDPRLLPRG
jgi:glycerophosphoryl diester phosphodiesterase